MVDTSTDGWRHRRMSPDRSLGKWHSNFNHEPRRTCFYIRRKISLTNRRAVGTASLNEMTRNEGADLLYRQRCDITQRSVLLRSDWSSDTPSDWLNLELLALPRPVRLI